MSAPSLPWIPGAAGAAGAPAVAAAVASPFAAGRRPSRLRRFLPGDRGSKRPRAPPGSLLPPRPVSRLGGPSSRSSRCVSAFVLSRARRSPDHTHAHQLGQDVKSPGDRHRGPRLTQKPDFRARGVALLSGLATRRRRLGPSRGPQRSALSPGAARAGEA